MMTAQAASGLLGSALELARLPAAIVTRHPRGGWTHAVRTGAGAARIYSGWWPTARAARRALR